MHRKLFVSWGRASENPTGSGRPRGLACSIMSLEPVRGRNYSRRQLYPRTGGRGFGSRKGGVVPHVGGITRGLNYTHVRWQGLGSPGTAADKIDF